MFGEIRRMFEDERAIAGAIAECCSPVTWATVADILVCGGQGCLRGVCVPIVIEIMKLILGV